MMAINGARNDPFFIRWGPLLAVLVSILAAYGSGIYAWSRLDANVYHLRSAIYDMQTPLSARVFANEAKLGEIERRQIEIRERLGIIDRGGTSSSVSHLQLMKRDVEALTGELASINTRWSDSNRRLEALGLKVVENEVMIRSILELLNPHAHSKK